jgi:hypothetical protein
VNGSEQLRASQKFSRVEEDSAKVFMSKPLKITYCGALC